MALFATQPQIKLDVTGMHCPKCVARVKEALENVDGVVKADVDLDTNSATVTGDVAADALVAAIEAIGFGAAAA